MPGILRTAAFFGAALLLAGAVFWSRTTGDSAHGAATREAEELLDRWLAIIRQEELLIVAARIQCGERPDDAEAAIALLCSRCNLLDYQHVLERSLGVRVGSPLTPTTAELHAQSIGVLSLARTEKTRREGQRLRDRVLRLRHPIPEGSP